MRSTPSSARWSRNSLSTWLAARPDTVPDVLATTAAWPDVTHVCSSAWASGQHRPHGARGPFYPDHGLERIVAYHERQEHRFTTAASELSTELDKPILTATELAVALPGNAAVRGVRETGRYCYPSSNRAVSALGHLWRYRRWRRHRGL
jgi:acetyltransferase